MTDVGIPVEMVQTFQLGPEALRLLAPEEVAEQGVLVLSLDEAGDAVTVALDPSAPEQAESFVRMRTGARHVEILRTSREAFEHLLGMHFLPFWTRRGWVFPGLPPVPAEAEEEPVEDEHAPEEAAAAPDIGQIHPAVLYVEEGEERCRALEGLLEFAGYEPRFAATIEDVAREVRRARPSIIAVRREGPLPPENLIPIAREAGGDIQLRVVPDPAKAVLGEAAGDQRHPDFLFGLTRFLIGVLASAGGGGMERTDARARYAERTARRLGFMPADIEAVRLAALLGDLDGHLATLRPGTADRPSPESGLLISLLDPSRTPYPVGEVLGTREERYDGTGPQRMAGDAIPAGGRVLAVVDAYVDMREAGLDGVVIQDRLRAASGAILDPRVVEALLRTERAERLVDRLDEDKERVLIVDPDPAAASLLEMRLANAGFAVQVVGTGIAAYEAAADGGVSLILSEVAVPETDGFTLLLRLRREEATREVPFVFVSERADRGATVRGLELGADDFLSKPVDLELLVAKAKGLVRKARARRPGAVPSAGVSGDLSDMELMDLLQVLAASRRTVRVRIESPGEPAAQLVLHKSLVMDASVGVEQGIPAFNAIMGRHSGRFVVESIEPPADGAIGEPLESLLLDACRLADEAEKESSGLAV